MKRNKKKIDVEAFVSGEIKRTTKLIQPKKKIPFVVTHHGKNIHLIETSSPLMTKFEQNFLLLSDVHFDNPSCNRAILSKLLREAVEKNAVIISCGDFLDLMQGKGDPRADKATLRSSLLSAAYFDRVIDETADYLCSDETNCAATHMAVLAEGNHESAWLKHRESDPTVHLARALKSRCNTQVEAGGYHGYIKLQVKIGTKGFQHTGLTIKYHHGSGGGGMSGGVLDARRMFTWVDADIIISGHNHASNLVGVQREVLSSQNGIFQIKQKYCEFIRIGTLKDEWHPSGWAVERGGYPMPCVQKWLRVFGNYEQVFSKNENRTRSAQRLNWEVTDAR